jgi:acyl carrier protein
VAEVAVLKLRWAALLHHYAKHGIPPIMRGLAGAEQRRGASSKTAAPVADLVEELQGVVPEARREHLATRTREQVVAVLGLSPAHPVGVDQGLTDLGMDSLMTVELGNRLSAMVDRALPSTVAFEYPTLKALTGHLEDLLSDRVDFSDRTAAPPLYADLDEDELTDALFKELDEAGY